MIVFVIGKKGSGKSYAVKAFLQRTERAYIVVDPLQEYPVDQRYDTIEAFLQAARNREVRGNVGLSLATDSEVHELFAWAWHLKPHILVVEEFHQYASAWSVSKPLQRLFRMGRHRGIHIIGITQRFVDMPQIAITQADGLMIFRQQGIRDLDAIARVTNEETATRVAELTGHEHVEYQF